MAFLTVRLFIIWLVVSINVLGGAILFKRLFPRESPWLGFIIPELTLVVLLNFVEHMVGLPDLLLLAFFTTLGSIWLIFDPSTKRRGLWLPGAIFIGSLAFSLVLRGLKPDIFAERDGMCDLPLVSSFCYGDLLPAGDTWLPGFTDAYYYTFTQYGASVLLRFFHLDIGTGFNLAAAMLGAYLCFFGSAVAWRITRGKVWITIAMAVVVQAAGTGSSAFLWFTSSSLNASASTNPFYLLDNNTYLKNILRPIGDYSQPDLMVPGAWSWTGGLHPTTGGQFVLLFAAWIMAEAMQRKRSNWPWIWSAILPLMAVITSTWCVPMMGLMFLGAVGFGLYYRWKPRDIRFVMVGLGAGIICLMPSVLDFLTTNNSPSIVLTGGDDRTQFALFALQWWPIYLPWLLLCFVWHRLPPAVQWMHLLVPAMYIYVELYTVGIRADMTGKFWGSIYGAGLIIFFPALACRREIIFRGALGVLLLSSLISLGYWSTDTWYNINDGDIFHLEGLGALRWDWPKARMMQFVSPMKNKILILGKSGWAYNDGQMLGAFTRNRCYIAWSGSNRCGDPLGETERREVEVNNMYDGKMDDPLTFLRGHDIAAVVVWGGDDVHDDVLNKLKKQLAPIYEYIDFRRGDPPNVGIFVYHPSLDNHVMGNMLPSKETP